MTGPEWGPNLLAMSPEDRAGWVALKRRADAAEAETARLRHDIEALAERWTRLDAPQGTIWRSVAVDDLRAVLAAERDPETAHRPCAGCDSIDESCRAVGCPAATKAGDQS